MRARADAAARTARDVLDATSALWYEKPLDDITLQEIADRAGVTVQTVLRRFGSKGGVVAACLEADAAGLVAERDGVAAGDVEGAIDMLLGHYERDGEAILRTLDLEHKLPEARTIVQSGREAHRDWCARVFAPHLPRTDTVGREVRLDAFVAATDLYLWKLLRRDYGYTRARTRQVLIVLLQGLISERED